MNILINVLIFSMLAVFLTGCCCFCPCAKKKCCYEKHDHDEAAHTEETPAGE